MKLATYLSTHQLTPTAFAAIIGVSQAAVSRYANGVRRPRKEILERIAQTTNGQVTPNDFYEVEIEGQAA